MINDSLISVGKINVTKKMSLLENSKLLLVWVLKDDYITSLLCYYLLLFTRNYPSPRKDLLQ